MNRVSVFSLAHSPSSPSPWRVRWRVDGRDRTRAFRTKAQAELLRSRLLTAAAGSEPFDPSTGEPVSWSRSTVSFYELTQTYVARKWKGWAASSRSSFVDAAVVPVTSLVLSRTRGRPDQATLNVALRRFGLLPESAWEGEPDEAEAEALAWLSRASLPMPEVTLDAVELALEACSLKQDGTPVKVNTLRRRRQALNAVLEHGVKRGHLTENPLGKSEWEAESVSVEVKETEVPSVADCRTAMAYLRTLGDTGVLMATFFSVMWLGGLRPSEVAALKVSQLTLPKEGWGQIAVSGASVDVGSRWTNTGARSDEKGLKWRRAGEVRNVPIPPELVGLLRDWCKDRKGLVFEAPEGGPVGSKLTGAYWSKAREHVFAEGDPLRSVPVYHLRHTNGSLLLHAGVNPVEAARRLGHSPEVLLRVYAAVMRGLSDEANAQVDALLSASS